MIFWIIFKNWFEKKKNPSSQINFHRRNETKDANKQIPQNKTQKEILFLDCVIMWVGMANLTLVTEDWLKNLKSNHKKREEDTFQEETGINQIFIHHKRNWNWMSLFHLKFQKINYPWFSLNFLFYIIYTIYVSVENVFAWNWCFWNIILLVCNMHCYWIRKFKKDSITLCI